MSVHSLRVWCAAGAAVLIAGVAMIIIAVASWQPLADAPAWWPILTTIVVASGLVVTIISTSTLSRRVHPRT